MWWIFITPPNHLITWRSDKIPSQVTLLQEFGWSPCENNNLLVLFSNLSIFTLLLLPVNRLSDLLFNYFLPPFLTISYFKTKIILTLLYNYNRICSLYLPMYLHALLIFATFLINFWRLLWSINIDLKFDSFWKLTRWQEWEEGPLLLNFSENLYSSNYLVRVGFGCVTIRVIICINKF